MDSPRWFSLERKDAITENPLFPHCLPAIPQRFFCNRPWGEYVVGECISTAPPGLVLPAAGTSMPKRVSWTDTAMFGANENEVTRVVFNCRRGVRRKCREVRKVIGFFVQGSAIRNGSMWKGAFRVSG